MTVKNGDVSILEGESELNSEEMFLKFFILQNSELHTFNTTQVLYLKDQFEEHYKNLQTFCAETKTNFVLLGMIKWGWFTLNELWNCIEELREFDI